MTIPKLTPYTGQVANPDGSQTQTEFTQNMFNQLSYEAQLATELDATVDGMNQAVTDVENSANTASASANAAEAAASTAGYQGLWPDTGGSALKGETWQTQVGGTPTGEYYTALQNTSVDPVGDNVNWKVAGTIGQQNLSDYTDIVYKASGGNSAVENMILGIPVATDVNKTCQCENGTIFKRIRSSTGTIDDYISEGFVSVKDFGAVGDGVTDDTLAFVAVRDFINSKGGGVLFFPKPQSFYSITNHKDAGDNSYWGYSFIFSFENLDGLTIYGNNAHIKVADGSRYGAFDQVTGDPIGDGTTQADQASPGTVFSFASCKNVNVYDLVVDGNNENLTLGGTYGDTGRQIQNTAFRVVGGTSENIRCFNSYFHHMGLDGIAVKSGASEFTPFGNISFFNVVSEYNGRQGLSLSGGNGTYFSNCKFSHTGKAGVYSAPGAGIDVEPESGNSTTNVVFDHCESINNTGVSVLFWDTQNLSKSVTFRNCEIWGNTNSALWIQGGSEHKVENCNIHGRIIKSEYTTFTGCNIDTEEHPDYGIYVATFITENQVASVYKNCNFNPTKCKGPLGSILQDCTVDCGWDMNDFPGGTAINLGAGLNKNLKFIDNIVNTGGVTPSVVASSSGIELAGFFEIDGDGTSLRWGTTSGEFGKLAKGVTQTQQLILRSDSAIGTRILGTRSALPSSGGYERGDIFFDNTPSSGAQIGWVCISSGNPGTWKPWGTISA